MFKKLEHLLLSLTASGLLVVAAITVNTTSLFHNGEPDCPEELLK